MYVVPTSMWAQVEKIWKKKIIIEWRHDFNTLNVDSYRQSGLVAIKLEEKNSFKKTWGLPLMKKCNYIFHFLAKLQ